MERAPNVKEVIGEMRYEMHVPVWKLAEPCQVSRGHQKTSAPGLLQAWGVLCSVEANGMLQMCAAKTGVGKRM